MVGKLGYAVLQIVVSMLLNILTKFRRKIGKGKMGKLGYWGDGGDGK